MWNVRAWIWGPVWPPGVGAWVVPVGRGQARLRVEQFAHQQYPPVAERGRGVGSRGGQSRGGGAPAACLGVVEFGRVVIGTTDQQHPPIDQ